MNDMKKMARPFGWLFALALVVAVLGRIGLTIAGSTGVLAFDYISAAGVPVLDVICSILTGSAFVAFLFAAGLALAVSTAGPVLYGALVARGDVKARPLTAFLAGWACALVALLCLVVVVLGILSAVQVGSMSSKLPGAAAHLRRPERGGRQPTGVGRVACGRCGREPGDALRGRGLPAQAGGRSRGAGNRPGRVPGPLGGLGGFRRRIRRTASRPIRSYTSWSRS